MKKEVFQEEYEKIEVPEEDVLDAIRRGRKQANAAGPDKKKKKRFKSFYVSAVTAAGILLTSSFAAPTFSNAMEKVPLIGNIYEDFNDLVGRSLESEKLITALNETASSGGIDVTVTRAYYDGAVIGVTFNVEGNVRANEEGKLQGLYEIFNGDTSIETKEIAHMKPSNQGFTGHIQVPYPELELPSDTTVPLEFLTIDGKEGNWKFEVPVEQLPYKTREVAKTSSAEVTDIKVRVDSLMKGQASTTIDYTVLFSGAAKHNQVTLAMYNDKGKRIHQMVGGIDLGMKTENGKGVATERAIILQPLGEKAEYIEIQPLLRMREPSRFVSLNESAPVQIASDTRDLSITVEKMEVDKDNAVFDFRINQGDEKGKGFEFFRNIARNDVTLVRKAEKDVHQKPMAHSIEVLQKEDLLFRSTFETGKVSDFNPEDYVLRVDLSGMSINIPVELERIKINMDGIETK